MKRGGRWLVICWGVAAGFATAAVAPCQADFSSRSEFYREAPHPAERAIAGRSGDPWPLAPRDPAGRRPPLLEFREQWPHRFDQRRPHPGDESRRGRFIHRPPGHWDQHRGRFDPYPPAERFVVCSRRGSALICTRY